MHPAVEYYATLIYHVSRGLLIMLAPICFDLEEDIRTVASIRADVLILCNERRHIRRRLSIWVAIIPRVS